MTIDGYCTLGVDREYDILEFSLLKAMDSGDVAKAIVAPPDRLLAVYNREGNDRMLSAARTHRDRFIPACSANPWYGEAAAQELRRACEEGARMLVLHPSVQGFSANDELAFPLISVAAEYKVPVYIHTGPPGNSTPWQVADLAERYQSVDFIMGHCGATDFWNDVIYAAGSCGNIYLESSMARPFIFARYLETLGKAKGILGSWAPLNDLQYEWQQMRKFIPQEAFNDIAGANVRRLLEKRGPL